MKTSRRGLLAAFAFGGAAAGVAAQASSAQARISCEMDDPGEALFGQLCADGKRPRVFLDGVEQTHAVTACPQEGWVKRHVLSPKGNVAFNPVTNEVLHEVVHGRVHWIAVRE